MRKDQQINVSISRTINMGNFNSLKVTAGYGYTITDDADVQEEYRYCLQYPYAEHVQKYSSPYAQDDF